MTEPLNALGLSHRLMREKIRPGDFCIDGTAGRGRDTAFLCELVGENGKVLAFDIQKEAVDSTKALLAEKGFSNAEVFLDSHENLENYAAPGEVDGIMFNFGWLPGGDHSVFSHGNTSIKAIRAGLSLLKKGGVMTLCIYYGKETGTEEKNSLLDFLHTIDPKTFTVILSDFVNRTGEPPLFAAILKENN